MGYGRTGLRCSPDQSPKRPAASSIERRDGPWAVFVAVERHREPLSPGPTVPVRPVASRSDAELPPHE
ncbi:protein of unknown function [Streptantibioticus cattleyicolor NRRL 8057 = DSM 46488]|nr:protein of unknown function [Streptantibioticus cattleyicolor NRRL 8057 = DSM 46488]